MNSVMNRTRGRQGENRGTHPEHRATRGGDSRTSTMRLFIDAFRAGQDYPQPRPRHKTFLRGGATSHEEMERQGQSGVGSLPSGRNLRRDGCSRNSKPIEDALRID